MINCHLAVPHLPAIGGNSVAISLPHVRAPVSLQAAAAAYLYNDQQGWTPWESNTQLMSAIQAAGGTSAFAAPGQLATTQSSYTALDNAGESPLAFFGGGSGAGTTTGTAGTATTGGATTANAGGAGGTFHPFSWIWSTYNTSVQVPMAEEVNSIQSEAGGVLNILLILDIAIVGILMMSGLYRSADIWRKFWKAFVVVALIGSAALYQPYFMALWTALPTYLSQGLGLAGSATGPAANFDNAWGTFLGMAHLAMLNSGSVWTSGFWLTLLFIAIAGVIVLGALVLLFLVWFTAQVIPQILLIVGPLLALSLLSNHTESIFFRYIHTLILFAVLSLVVNIIAVLALAVIISTFNAIPEATDGYAIATNLTGAAIVIAILAAAVKSLPRIFEHMVGSAGAPSMAAAHAALTHNVYRPTQTAITSAPGHHHSRCFAGSTNRKITDIKKGNSVPKILRLLLVVLPLLAAGCAVHQDDPLPTVQANDPTWSLMPDHLVWGQLPK